MKSLIAFTKKEFLEQIRSGKLMLLLILFVMFGIMNPAIAKLTPWLFEMMSDSLAQSGMIVTEIKVSAMDSWVQFFKNVPMGLIAFVLIESSIFTKEYQTGTLVLAITKGLARYKVVIAKTLLLFALWTVYYWIHVGITYGYNAYFWDNAVANSLGFSVVCWWLFGVWVIVLIVLFSAIVKTNSGVLGGTGLIVGASYILGLFPKLEKYVPTLLMDGNSLIYGIEEPEFYFVAMLVTAVLGMMGVSGSIWIMDRREI